MTVALFVLLVLLAAIVLGVGVHPLFWLLLLALVLVVLL